jgi:hypothetical protein
MKSTATAKTESPEINPDSTPEDSSPAPTRPETPPPSGFRYYRLVVTLAVVWVLVIVAVWFWRHPLFEVEFPLYPAEITRRIAGAIGGTLLDLTLLALCVVGSTALGRWLARWFWPDLKGSEGLIFSAGLGFGSNMLLILGLGLLGGVNPVVAYALLALELLSLWPLGWPLLRGTPQANPWRSFSARLKEGWAGMSRWEKALVCWLTGAAVLTLFVSLAPPLAWDALMYHLEGPKQYIAAGRIEALPRLGQASFPFGMEMLFTWGMLLHGDGLAQSFSWLFGLLGAGAIYLFAQRFFTRFANPRPVGLLAAALYLSIPHVWLLMTWAYTDLMLSFYSLLALYALLLALSGAQTGLQAASQVTRYAVLGGAMAGVACSGKYSVVTAAFGILVAALAFGGMGRPRPAWRTIFIVAFGFGVAGTVSFAPWLLRNIFFSGNPFAPLFGGIKGWDAEEVGFLNGAYGHISLDIGVILGRPFGMALLGRDGGLYDSTISPLFLALLPLGVWAAFREKVVAALWLAVGVTYLGWLFGIALSDAADHTRLLLPVFPWLALITAHGLLEFLTKSRTEQAKLLRVVAALATGGFLAASGFMLLLFFVANDPIPYHFGFQTRQERLEDQLGSYERAVNFVNAQLPANADLFMFFEPRAYYFDRVHSADHNDGGQFFTLMDRFHTPQAVYDELRRRGATHILVNENLLEFLLNTPTYRLIDEAKAGRQLLDDLQSQGYFEQIYRESGFYTIYKLKP